MPVTVGRRTARGVALRLSLSAVITGSVSFLLLLTAYGSLWPMILASSITHPHGPASATWSSTHWFAIGLLAGFLVALVAPGIVKGVVIAGDLIALGWSSIILGYADSPRGRWVLLATAFLLIGMLIGVVRGLRHLGDAEFNGRLRNIRNIGRWI